MLSPLQQAFLQAATESIARIKEVIPILAVDLGVQENEIYYSWMHRKFPNKPGDLEMQRDQIGSTEWTYFFHGLECDLSHEDGRFLRIEFGPGGRTDALGAFSILQYVQASRTPWGEYPNLKRHLIDAEETAHSKATKLYKSLEDLGYFELIEAQISRSHDRRSDDQKLLDDRIAFRKCLARTAPIS